MEQSMQLIYTMLPVNFFCQLNKTIDLYRNQEETEMKKHRWAKIKYKHRAHNNEILDEMTQTVGKSSLHFNN